jgi:hypothetical protein
MIDCHLVRISSLLRIRRQFSYHTVIGGSAIVVGMRVAESSIKYLTE